MAPPKLWTSSALLVACTLATAPGPFVFGQAGGPIKGRVLSVSGQPIPGIAVYSKWKLCCPYGESSAKTDDSGQFQLDRAGHLLHVFGLDFQPQTLILKDGDSDIQIVLDSSTPGSPVPTCKQPANARKEVSWGEYGVHFAVNAKAKLRGGKPDVDYVRYVLTLPKSKSYLEFWFGPYAMNPEPDDELFMGSSDFSQRNLRNADGKVFGEDGRGHLKSGGNWRHFAIFGEGGALYRDASEQDAQIFDQIIDSVCIVPGPQS